MRPIRPRSSAKIANGHYYRAADSETLRNVFKQIDEYEKTKVEVTQFRDFRDLQRHCLDDPDPIGEGATPSPHDRQTKLRNLNSAHADSHRWIGGEPARAAGVPVLPFVAHRLCSFRVICSHSTI